MTRNHAEVALLCCCFLHPTHCQPGCPPAFLLQGRGFSRAMTATEAQAFVGDVTCPVNTLQDDKLFLDPPSTAPQARSRRHRRDIRSELLDLTVRCLCVCACMCLCVWFFFFFYYSGQCIENIVLVLLFRHFRGYWFVFFLSLFFGGGGRGITALPGSYRIVWPPQQEVMRVWRPETARGLVVCWDLVIFFFSLSFFLLYLVISVAVMYCTTWPNVCAFYCCRIYSISDFACQPCLIAS